MLKLRYDPNIHRLKYIPLGVTKNNTGVYMLYPEIEGQQISNTCLITGGPGSGKSVTSSVLIISIAQRRPVIVCDPVGRDHYLNYMPNDQGVFLPPNMPRQGLKGKYYYYPVHGSRLKQEYESIVRPDFTKYEVIHYTHLGFSAGAAIYLQNIISEYGPFNSMDSFYQFMENFPISERQSQYYAKAKPIKLTHNRYYKAGDVISKISKENIMKVLPLILRMEAFRMDDKEEIPYYQHFTKGENIIMSYNDRTLAKIEVDYMFTRLEEYRDMNAAKNRPFIFIEEAHEVFGGSQSDTMAQKIESFVLTCRKLSVGICLIMPEILSLDENVLSNIDNKIVFKLKGQNARSMINSIGDERAYIIPYLRKNKFTNERQFFYWNEDFNTGYLVDKPYEAPCAIHREVILKREA